jgi:hypothetical protein
MPQGLWKQSRMRVIENREYSRRTRFAARYRRISKSALNHALRILLSIWRQAFPVPFPDGPGAPPNIVKAATLREGARLSESVSAISDKRAGY